ncbi:S-adenosylmethionine-dependent methyltransferase Rv2258c-like [Diadema antillarum]|uniref:S-adenosylmethionine-dependent methyltransferase Rv2258c-like n=1 Tax=Diadema antillarum TaxID=105358 RepID=UPI003A8996DE
MSGKYANETFEEFCGRLGGIISDGHLSLCIALGVRSGLFDVLVKHQGNPMTSEELAKAAGLKERYVREWLGAMTCSHIVDLDATGRRYHLPARRAGCFEDGNPAYGTTQFSLSVPILSEVFNNMSESIKADGPRGLTFEASKSFNEVDEKFSVKWYQDCLCQQFIPSYPEIQGMLERGIQMLDLGCGRGVATRTLAKQFPNSHFTGLDIREENVKEATEAAEAMGLKNVEYVTCDATGMSADWTDKFDYVFTFNVLHDTPRPDTILADVRRVLKKDGGRLSVVEFGSHSEHAKNIDSYPSAGMLYTVSLFHCLPVSYQEEDSLGLGTLWGKDKVVEFLKQCGFVVKSVSEVPMLPEAHFLCEVAQK